MNAFSDFVDAFHAHRLVDPNRCVALGVDVRLDELPDPSLAAGAAQVASAETLLERASAIERRGLDFDEDLDLELAVRLLEQEVHDGTYLFNGRTTLQQLPTAGDDISSGLFSLFINDPRPAEERLANITARLEMVPDYLDALVRRLKTPVGRWVSIDREKVEGLPSLFGELRGWAEQVEFRDRPRFDAARTAAETALNAYLDHLSGIDTTDGFHVGESTARRIVELRGIELSLEKLHRIAQDFLTENRAVLESLRKSLAARYGLPDEVGISDLQRHLLAKFRVELGPDGLASILEAYRRERDAVLEFIREKDLFPVPDAQEMKILRTPSFLEPTIPAGAMMSPPPFRDGVRTSIVYLTLSEALIDEHTRLGIPGMIIHEGIPGHHLQLTHAALHSSVIRRHCEPMELAEGWTTMLEDYMLDVGYMGDLSDEARFIGKLDIARIGARVGIDLYFMTGEESFLDLGVVSPPSEGSAFARAGHVLREVTGFVPGRVEAELNWYSIERGYPLSYLAGNHLVNRLKADVERRAGASGLGVDRRFHRGFLEAGNMPVEALRKVFAHEGLI